MKCALFAGLLLTIVVPLVGRAADAPAPAVRPEVAALVAADQTVSAQGSIALRNLHEEIVRDLCAELKKSAATPDRSYRGPLNALLVAAGTWRAEEAVDILVPILDLKLDPSTFPAGIRIDPAVYFPAAMALSRIGGPAVMDKVVERMDADIDENTLRLCTYVLDKCASRSTQRQSSIALAESFLARSNTPRQKANLAKAVTLLKDTTHGLLPPHR